MSRGSDILQSLSPAVLRALASSLRDGPLSFGITMNAVRQLVGSEAEEVHGCLEDFAKDGMSTKHVARLLDAVADRARSSPDIAVLFELVLSGPDAPGVPTEDTAAVFQTLISDAEREILLVGYAVHGGRKIFESLALKMSRTPDLRVVFCLDASRKPGDASLDQEVIARFALEFRRKHWPWPDLPKLYYDPRSLSVSPDGKASLHAKCIVIDRKTTLITSANFTEAAQKRNIELGVLVRNRPMAERVVRYFEKLIDSGILMQCPL